jgi:uncharacterized protein (TIGR02569 family)
VTNQGPGPPTRVVEAFGLAGAAERLPGGQGGTWRLGEAVLKPSQGEDFVRWVSHLLARLDGRRDFRVSPPLRARDGSWSVAGWTAWRHQPGAHQPGRWLDIVRVGDIFHESIQEETLPAFLSGRTDRWAVADHFAWGELPLPPAIRRNGLVQELVAAQRPVLARSQLVHGDLGGNVLFHPQLPPLVIDVSPYWRPLRFAAAVVAVDALVCEGAGDQLIESLQWDADDAQFLLRALLFRAITDLLHRPPREAGHRHPPLPTSAGTRASPRGDMTSPPARLATCGQISRPRFPRHEARSRPG